jgi:hypothetical protein
MARKRDRDNEHIAAFMEGSPGPGGRMWENAKKHRAGQPCGDPLCGNLRCNPDGASA